MVGITKDYLVPTLHIEEGTQFMDTSLPEVTLKLSGGVWVYSDSSEFKLDNPVDTVNHSLLTIPYKMPASEPTMVIGDLYEEGCEIAFTINTGNYDIASPTSVIHFALYNVTIQIHQFLHTVELLYNNQQVQIFSGYPFIYQYSG